MDLEDLKMQAAKLATKNAVRARLGLPPLSSLNGRDTRAVVKLNFEERCEVLAFIACGVPTAIITSVMEISANTVSRLRNCSPEKYAKEYTELMSYNSVREFCDRHLTEGHENEVIALYPRYKRPSR